MREVIAARAAHTQAERNAANTDRRPRDGGNPKTLTPDNDPNDCVYGFPPSRE
jgi:hypothetical protein